MTAAFAVSCAAHHNRAGLSSAPIIVVTLYILRSSGSGFATSIVSRTSLSAICTHLPPLRGMTEMPAPTVYAVILRQLTTTMLSHGMLRSTFGIARVQVRSLAVALTLL